MMLRATLSWPPSVNHAYRNIPGMGRALTSKAKRWKEGARIIFRSAYRPRERYAGKVRLTITLASPRWMTLAGAKSPYRKADLSNRIKLTEDSVADACLVYGDEQVWRLVIDKVFGAEEMLTVVLERLEEKGAEGLSDPSPRE